MKRYLPMLLIFALVGCGSDAPKPPPKPEEMIAVLDEVYSKGGVAKYAVLLDQLQAKCTEPRNLLADYMYFGSKTLTERDRPTTIYQFGSAVIGTIPPGSPRMKCQEIAAALLALTITF